MSFRHVEINSSVLSDAYYDESTGRLVLSTRNGSHYQYENVDSNAWVELLRSKSPGRWWSAFRNYNPAKRVESPPNVYDIPEIPVGSKVRITSKAITGDFIADSTIVYEGWVTEPVVVDADREVRITLSPEPSDSYSAHLYFALTDKFEILEWPAPEVSLVKDAWYRVSHDNIEEYLFRWTGEHFSSSFNTDVYELEKPDGKYIKVLSRVFLSEEEL